MTDSLSALDAQHPTKALLQLCKRLERARTLPDILGAVAPVVEGVLGYAHTWLALVGERPGFVSVISQLTSDPHYLDRHQIAQTMDMAHKADQYCIITNAVRANVEIAVEPTVSVN